MLKKTTLSIIGLGKLGSPMVAAFASKGYSVIGVDVNTKFVEKINQGQAPVSETNLQEFISANKKLISATQDYERAILNSDITFIIVPTPSEKEGGFSTKYVVDSGKNIGKSLKKKSNFHLVALTSTVAPGSTESEIVPVLEEYSGKKCGVDFGFCYNPEFIALGSVIRDILNPDFILIGESDSRSGEILSQFYSDVCENNPPIKRMNFINAELTKIAVNTFITTKISYANMMAEICEKLPGGNIDTMTSALGLDRRIGSKGLKGALGYGGPCLPRDNRALIYTAQKLGTSLPIAEATDEINKYQVYRLVEKILSLLPKNGKVSILGLSYKTDTNVIEESQSVEIAKQLAEKGVLVKVYDPVAMENAKQILKKVIFTSSLKEAVKDVDVIFIGTSWEEFRSIEPSYLKKKNGKVVLIDCWRIFDASRYKGIVKYLPIGINYA